MSRSLREDQRTQDAKKKWAKWRSDYTASQKKPWFIGKFLRRGK